MYLLMSLKLFIEKLNSSPELVEFDETMSIIADGYSYNPVSFKNGDVINKAGENDGSCKLLYFAKVHHLSKQQTLACFGKYYRQDVLTNPTGKDHQNIRNFMQSGWHGVEFYGVPLVEK